MKHIVPFTLPEDAQEAEILLTSMGKVVTTVPVMPNGREVVSVDFGDLPSGVYCCQLVVNKSQVSRRDLMVH
jgi:hypothetical protein